MTSDAASNGPQPFFPYPLTKDQLLGQHFFGILQSELWLTLLKVQWKSATISLIKGITNSKTETNILSFRLIISTITGRVLAPELHRRGLITWYLNKMTTFNQNVIVSVLVLLCHVR
jgi:hypothetical protein